MEMPLGTVDSISPDLDGLVCAVSSPCALVEVHVFLFYGGVELGFWAFHFPLGMGEDLTHMLMNSSMISMG